MKSFLTYLLVFSFLCVSMSLRLISPEGANAQVRAKYDLGASGLGQALKRLQTTASVLHTAAHPDDEDSGLLAYLARKEQARTAYLSLNRGDGGQNVIGEELFEGLGVIRTEELLQARRLDGGGQFFTRVMDYGFSKRREEAARIWGEREVLGDMVRTIRLYRPLVIISRFSGTPADGHGQHQLAGYLSPIAFKAAADPKEFPEHFREGLEPWQAKKFYVSQGFANNPQNRPTLVLNTGDFDPLIGRSYFEIAMEGRSQHKSQEMGMLELRGAQRSGMRLVENLTGKDLAGEKGVLDGIDTSIKGIAALANDTNGNLTPKLAALQATAEEALRSYDPFAPEKLLPILARGKKEGYDAEWSTRDPDSKALLREKQLEFARAMQMAAGVVVDALSNTETIVGGDSADVAVRIFAPANSTVKIVETTLKAPNGWTVAKTEEPAQPPATGFRPRREDAFGAAFFKVTTSPDAKPTTPYWLESPRKNFNFDWSNAGDARNQPFGPPLMTAMVRLSVGGQEIEVEREVEYRYSDDIRGEIRRDVSIVPALVVGLESNLLVAPVSSNPQKHRLVMTVTNNTPGAVKGTARFALPAGWQLSPSTASFELARKGEKTAQAFDLTIPANTKADSYSLTAIAEMNGKTFDRSVQDIAYPHIQTHRIYTRADAKAQVMDLRIAPVKVGYIMGSGDKVPDAIRRMGVEVTMLDEKMLSTGELSQFDTIVVGIRASQVRPDYVANNGRLTEFMNRGGTLIVQYQQQEYIRYNLPPYPAKMDGNIRVTDENAAVKVLQPQHPIFNTPNKIGDADWTNWVQERNLYSFSDFDAAKYTPLLESHDEGEPERTGAMVYAEVGKGEVRLHFVFVVQTVARRQSRSVSGLCEYAEPRKTGLMQSKEQTEKFPAQSYKDNVLTDCFADAKQYFLDAYHQVDLAHAVMLAEQGIISGEELRAILHALVKLDFNAIRSREYDGTFEDLFYLLQQEIAKLCDPDVAGKLHTARSRNDIDVTIYRLQLRQYCLRLTRSAMDLRKVFLDLASEHHETLIPAYTHTQPAQPSTMAHFLLAMAENVGRDIRRLQRAFENMNYCPLGSGAITTTGFPINRHRVAELLGFSAPTVNSYASIASVDYFIETLGAVAALLVNTGKFAQEFLLMAMMEFNAIRLPDGFVQGSSIMPQKRNPVALEHIRAIGSKALGQTLGVITAVHNTPFGDINDVEDDLQPLIYSAMRDADRAVALCASTLRSATFNFDVLRKRAGENFIAVTELADTIVRKENLPFRISHKIVGNCVKAAIEAGSDVTHAILQGAAKEVIGRDLSVTETELKAAVSPENFVNIRTIYGGTAPSETRRALTVERERETDDDAWFVTSSDHLRIARGNLDRIVKKHLTKN